MPPKRADATQQALPLDPRCPPLRVRHKKTGVITNWSTLFKKNLGDFEPWYRPGSDERLQHQLRVRRYEAQQAMRGGDPFAGSHRGFTTMMDGDVLDGEVVDADPR